VLLSDGGMVCCPTGTAALRDHPDKNPGDSEAVARFKAAGTAYQVRSACWAVL
jgi:hypothetical protein